jgi:carbonic anhydrase
MIAAAEALSLLREGNRRFVAGQSSSDSADHRSRRAALVDRQEPFAIVLGCSDSRVPAELVFDQGFGDLFVIRVAGNIVAPSQIGSVEFAASRFLTRLVVVLGHSQCGAVTATLEELLGKATTSSENLRSIVERVRPPILTLLAGRDPATLDLELLTAEAVRANVRAAANHLRHGSGLLERMIRDDGLAVVGADYSLESGVVTFFDGVDRL